VSRPGFARAQCPNRRVPALAVSLEVFDQRDVLLHRVFAAVPSSRSTHPLGSPTMSVNRAAAFDIRRRLLEQA